MLYLLYARQLMLLYVTMKLVQYIATISSSMYVYLFILTYLRYPCNNENSPTQYNAIICICTYLRYLCDNEIKQFNTMQLI